MRIIVKLAICISILPSIVCAQVEYRTNWEYYSQLQSRQETIRSALAGKSWEAGDDHRKRIYLGVLKLYTGIDESTGLQYLWDAVNDTTYQWGSFNVFSFMDAILRLKEKLPPALVAKAQERLAASFGEDKGFTENHKLQYRSSIYLFGQTWPDGSKFADGLTPLQAKKEAEEWIYDWIDRTVSIGQLEFDSVNYHGLYYLCMTSLYDFSQDPVMKRRAWMMMQVLLADWAPEYLKGNWIGAHSREKYNQATHTILNSGVAIPFGYLFFGDSQYHPELPEPYYVGLAAIQQFNPLTILGNIATDRSQPYVHRETKAPRRGFGINTSDLPIWKYNYVTKNYALGSSYGDITAVENHRWDLTWVSKKDGSTCFFINPSYSAKQLVKYFDAPEEKIVGLIVRQRPYYKDPNKWVEGSPYEEVFQHENTIVALYDIPQDERNGHVNGFFSKIIEKRIETSDDWIFCSTDSIYFAVKTFTHGEWHEEDDHFRLTLNSRQTGVLMEVAQQSQTASFDAFQRQILKNPLHIDLKNLSVVYTNSNGDKLDFSYGKHRILNNKKINFKDWPLFEGPFVNSKVRSKVITIQYGEERLVLDFNKDEVRLEGVH